jgi:UDP-galactopyranose mutase
MDVTINEALSTAVKFLEAAQKNARMPAFAIDPLA